MTGPGSVIAASFAARCRADGLVPPPGLRLLAWHQPGSVPEPLDGPHALGRLHERLVSGTERTRRGAWYTPTWLAELLVERAVARPGPVADPTCGGGVFLLAAADRLRQLGATVPDIVGSLLWGADTDDVAVAVTEAALWWWSADAGAPTLAGTSRLVHGDPLLDIEIPRSTAVVGNPPFLGQLKSRTTIDDQRRLALKARWGGAVGPYTDSAWLFLLAAVDAVEPGGTVALVQPQSVLAARDAGPVRAAVDARAELVDCWFDDGSTFAAAVQVCAPVLHALGARTNDWLAARARALGIPEVDLGDGPTLGDLAEVTSGFRDEYYGLVAAVRERGPEEATPRRLVTVGAIDPLELRAGAVRFSRRRWLDPVVDVSRVDGRACRWVESQTRPKLLVATQTKVVEAVVDEPGDLVGSVPAIPVCPRDPDDLWRLAAALHAPAVSAWMLRRSAGTALAADAAKPTKALLASLPLPVDRAAWELAAEAARGLAAGSGGWASFGRLADAAYGIDDPHLLAWWLSRRPVRSPASHATPGDTQ